MLFAYFGKEKVTDIRVLGKLLSYNGLIGCDVETISLEDRTPLGAAFAINPKEAFYFPIDSPEFPWNKLRNPNIPIVFHNSSFDVQVLQKYSGYDITNTMDSCIAAQLIGLPPRLGELCAYLFDRPVRPIEDLIGPKGKSQLTMDKVPVDKVAERACKDACDALEAWNEIIPVVPKEALELETRAAPVLLDIENRGIRIDLKNVILHKTRLEKDMAYYKMVCGGMGFNPGSGNELAAKLEMDDYKVLYKRSKDGKRRPRLDKDILTGYYANIPYIRMVLNYRSSQTLLTHLIRPLSEGRYITNHGVDINKIHPRLNTNIVDTGRLSRSKPATQNIQENLRDIFIPSEGNIFYDWDFSQIELRWAAYLWEDKNMQSIFKQGLDVHQATMDELIARGLGGLLGTTPMQRRRTTKALNFSILYGGDEYTLWNRLRVPEIHGKQLLYNWFKVFPDIEQGIKLTTKFALDNGYTKTFLGRRRDLSEKINSGNKMIEAGAVRALVNHVIQGSAGETMKEAIWLGRKEPQIHVVHDEILLDAPENYQYLGYLHRPAPFDTPITLKKGYNWKDVKEVSIR